jgi:hypothetical protein
MILSVSVIKKEFFIISQPLHVDGSRNLQIDAEISRGLMLILKKKISIFKSK